MLIVSGTTKVQPLLFTDQGMTGLTMGQNEQLPQGPVSSGLQHIGAELVPIRRDGLL